MLAAIRAEALDFNRLLQRFKALKSCAFAYHSGNFWVVHFVRCAAFSADQKLTVMWGPGIWATDVCIQRLDAMNKSVQFQKNRARDRQLVARRGGLLRSRHREVYRRQRVHARAILTQGPVFASWLAVALVECTLQLRSRSQCLCSVDGRDRRCQMRGEWPFSIIASDASSLTTMSRQQVLSNRELFDQDLRATARYTNDGHITIWSRSRQSWTVSGTEHANNSAI